MSFRIFTRKPKKNIHNINISFDNLYFGQGSLFLETNMIFLDGPFTRAEECTEVDIVGLWEAKPMFCG